VLGDSFSSGELELLITNIGFIISIIITVGTGFVVLFKSSRREVKIPFFLFTVSYVVFMLSHIAGINAPTPELARKIFMLNMNNVFIIALASHWIIAAIGGLQKYKKFIVSSYVIALGLIFLFLLFPRLFMEGVQPMLYFPNYYKIGALYSLMAVYQFTFMGAATWLAWRAYRKAKDFPTKKRMFYFFLMPVIGYPLGFAPAITLYYPPFDPIVSIFLWAWMIPLAYGVIKDDLLDIRIIAKRALAYLLLVAASTTGLVIINWSNAFILARYPHFPHWLVPLLSSIVGVGIAILVWNRLRETEVLKYEFINVITHKFRTPMTHIKFSVDELRTTQSQEMKTAAIDRIEIANSRLLELTNVLVETSQNEGSRHLYTMEQTDLNKLAEQVLHDRRGDIAARLITVEKELSPDLKPVFVDIPHTKSVLQILLENAIMYSKKGGVVRVKTQNKERTVVLSVQDRGVGISAGEMKLLFSKFYRTPEATAADTEGMGMGLFIARTIAENQGGKLRATSPGMGLGSTFFLELPAYNAKKKPV